MLAKIFARNLSGNLSEITVEQMQDELKRLGGEMSERLDSLEKEISWISKEQREGFERVESLLISALPLIATIDDEAARTKLLAELRPKFQRVIDEISQAIREEGEEGRATTIEQSEIVQSVIHEGFNNTISTFHSISDRYIYNFSEIMTQQIDRHLDEKSNLIKAEALIQKGIALSAQGKYEEAIACYDSAYKLANREETN
jgi:tetratricopeptide (TPR) repeat protein